MGAGYTQEFIVERYRWGSPSSRRCALTLAVGDVAFADFDRDANGQLFLLRISFDGFGCCTPDRVDVKPMDMADSRSLIDQVESDEELGTDETRALLRRYFETHRNVIWEEALIEYGLVSTRM